MSKKSSDIAALSSDSVERNRELGFPDLEPNRRAFCIEYVSNGYKHRDAAVKVGFSANTGITLKREPLVAAFISDLLNTYLAESIVTKQTLDTYLDELEDIAMGRVDINMVSADGEEFSAKKFHADLAMKVYNEKSKLHGIVKDDNDKNTAVNLTINMGDLTGPVTIEGEVVQSNE